MPRLREMTSGQALTIYTMAFLFVLSAFFLLFRRSYIVLAGAYILGIGISNGNITTIVRYLFKLDDAKLFPILLATIYAPLFEESVRYWVIKKQRVYSSVNRVLIFGVSCGIVERVLQIFMSSAGCYAFALKGQLEYSFADCLIPRSNETLILTLTICLFAVNHLTYSVASSIGILKNNIMYFSAAIALHFVYNAAIFIVGINDESSKIAIFSSFIIVYGVIAALGLKIISRLSNAAPKSELDIAL